MIMAGSETTASFLSGATYYILSNQALYEKLKQEVRATYAKEMDLQSAGTRELHLLDLVIREALRMYPPTPSTLPRRTEKRGDVIDGCYVPGDVRCLSLSYARKSYMIKWTYKMFRFPWVSTTGQQRTVPRTGRIRRRLTQAGGSIRRRTSIRMVIAKRANQFHLGHEAVWERGKNP